MSEATYMGVSGFIQFDPKEREVGERTVRDIVVRPTNSSSGQNFYVTLWPDFKDVELEKGEFVAIEGKYSATTKEDKTYHNLSCQRIAVRGETIQAPKPETVNTGSGDAPDPF